MRAKLIAERKKLGLSQKAVARKIGAESTCYCRFETGERDFGADRKRKIRKLFSCYDDDLFYNAESRIC